MATRRGKRPEYVPERGDVVWLSFDPRAGHEQAGRRPAVVLSPATYNGKVSLALFCPITSQVKGYPFEILLEGLPIHGVVLADQIKSLDWRARNAEYAFRLPSDTIRKIATKAALLIGHAA